MKITIPEMALRLSKVFGRIPEGWLRHQLQYDLWWSHCVIAHLVLKKGQCSCCGRWVKDEDKIDIISSTVTTTADIAPILSKAPGPLVFGLTPGFPIHPFSQNLFYLIDKYTPADLGISNKYAEKNYL
jgi:hypothetical protein